MSTEQQSSSSPVGEAEADHFLKQSTMILLPAVPINTMSVKFF